MRNHLQSLLFLDEPKEQNAQEKIRADDGDENDHEDGASAQTTGIVVTLIHTFARTGAFILDVHQVSVVIGLMRSDARRGLTGEQEEELISSTIGVGDLTETGAVDESSAGLSRDRLRSLRLRVG